jgi:ATP-dependent Clp protease adaptor protein ClpS
MAKTEIQTKIKPNLAIAEPNLYKVIYMNDDVTTMEFVVETLMDFFDYNEGTAVETANTINDEGSAVVAILPYELAEQKGIEITSLARNNNFPLQIKLEADN